MNLLQKLSTAYGTPLYNRTQTIPQTEGFTIVSVGENTLEILSEGATYYVSIRKNSQHKTIEDTFELQEFIAERDATFNYNNVEYVVAQGTLKLFAV